MICGGCGADRLRIRTIFNEDGSVRKEECASCNPGSFDPEWLNAKPAMAWEAYPNKYEKFSLPDGRVGYRAKDEWQQDTQDKIAASYQKVDASEQQAIEQKRARRRTAPMSQAEIESALNRWRPRLEDETEKNRQRWNASISQLLQ